MTKPTPNDLYRAAQELVRVGQPVFPCRPRFIDAKHKDKAPLTKNGLKDATLDITQIKRWWKAHGDSALGLPTGIIWDVLDVDIKNGIDGRIHLTKLQEQGLLNGVKRVVYTPSGGLHLYFKARAGLTNKAKNNSLGLDVRARGGYVLAPPSYIEAENYKGVYADAGEMQNVDPDTNDEPLYWDEIVWTLAPISGETNQPLQLPSTKQSGSIAGLRNFVANLKPGDRNPGLYWAVSRCIENGIDPHELVEAALLTELPEAEILQTIGSALKRAGIRADELPSEAEAQAAKVEEMFPD